MAVTKHSRLTVGGLRELKGKRQLTMLFVETPDEAAAAAAAGIDILSIVEAFWSPAMREAAGDCFIQVGLIYGQHCTYEDQTDGNSAQHDMSSRNQPRIIMQN